MRLPPSLFTILLLLVASTLTANADTFEYTYVTGPGIPIAATLSFDEPFILTSSATIDAADFASSTNSDVLSLEVNPTMQQCSFTGNIGPGSCVAIFYTDRFGTVGSASFNSSSLDAEGSYVFGRAGTLTITDLSPIIPSTVPEPSSIALFGTGILGLAGLARRKFLS